MYAHASATATASPPSNHLQRRGRDSGSRAGRWPEVRSSSASCRSSMDCRRSAASTINAHVTASLSGFPNLSLRRAIHRHELVTFLPARRTERHAPRHAPVQDGSERVDISPRTAVLPGSAVLLDRRAALRHHACDAPVRGGRHLGRPEVDEHRRTVATQHDVPRADVAVLSPPQLLHMPGRDEPRRDARLLECLERGEPVHPGGLAHRRLDLVTRETS